MSPASLLRTAGMTSAAIAGAVALAACSKPADAPTAATPATPPAAKGSHAFDGAINAPDFAARALEIFDRWVAEGIVEKGRAA